MTRLRSLFESLPPPSPPSTALPLPRTPDEAPPPPEDEATRCAQDRKAYDRELWRKCGASVVASVPPSPTPSSSTAPPLSSDNDRQRQAALDALRWKAFEQYADEKERELWRAFVELDHDGDMQLRKEEVREACRMAGIEVREGAIDEFVRTVDRNGDGVISFDEWRDFLLLLPRQTSMKEIWRYWQAKRLERPSMSRLTQDGDVTVVIGRGKSGWNKLLGKSSSTSAATARPRPEDRDAEQRLADATNLHKLEPVNDEQKYVAACERLRAERRNKGKARANAEAVAKALPSSTSLDFEQSGVIVTDEEREEVKPKVQPHTQVASVREDEEEEEHEPTHDMFAGAGKFLLAGGMAGAVSRTATAPFDRLKVYLITSPTSAPPKPDPAAQLAKSGKPPRPGAGTLVNAIRAVYAQGGGIKAFWTGNGLNIIKIFPESAIKFLSYESAKRIFAQYWDKVPDQTLISNSSRFVAGGIGGVISQFCIYPIESLKTRVMSSSGGCKKGNALIVQTMRDMWHAGGFRFFFRGLPAGLIGVFPYSAIDMSTFEGIKLAYTKWAGEEPGIAGSLTFGAISGGVGASSVYPLNLVRTRLQAQGTPAHPQTYTGIRDAAFKCYQREGWRGFYKGLTPTLVKVVPAVAISYAVYDTSKKMLFAQEEPICHAHEEDSIEES
ncbi:mitochondrial carrier protein [Rhodotorula toruloides]|uniref:Mitochondrial carrier protein n=1 Tax=Rhodotorula toruloides TaxID=5286 RepID=A0A511KI45_RHOTO|nr:mitochondrial carrier protein [Rhodotorula toruloides]